MISKFLSYFAFIKKYFKSLPDGRRVFFADFPWNAYYIIPNDSVEKRLYKLNAGINLLLFGSIFTVLIFIILIPMSSFKNVLATYSGAIYILIFFVVGGITRRVLFRNELVNLQKIDLPSSISTFYKNLSDGIRIHSKNSFPSYDISLLLSIPDSQEKIVMLSYSESFPNVLRCRLDGSIIWQAELPTVSNDVYTNVEWSDGNLHAFSRSCNSILLNEKTGKIISK